MNIEKSRSRNDIKSEISKREQEKTERLNSIRRVVDDKKIEANTAKELRLTGTSEGADEIKKTIRLAADATEEEFERQKNEIKKEVFDESKKFEDELLTRSEVVKGDIEKLKHSISKIDTRTARSKMQEAERTAEKDRDILDQSREEQERNRAEGEKEEDQLDSEIKGTSITFNNE